MTKDVAMQTYFERWASENGIKAVYPASVEIKDSVLPYMTYEFIDGGMSEQPTPIVVNLWFYTESEAVPNAAARSLRRYIQENDLIVCDEGAVFVVPGDPWSQAITDETLKTVKRRYINITLDHLTP